MNDYMPCNCCGRDILPPSIRSIGVCRLCDGFVRAALQGLAPKLLFEEPEVVEQDCQRAVAMARAMTLALMGQRKEADRG